MSDVAIHVEHLGKHYRIGQNASYSTFRDAVTNFATNAYKQLRKPQSGEDLGYFWALKDITFDVTKGEVVGIIGRNGAGKSTLLKIFSRVTDPTEGFVKINGRVGSILEVGTGFHPELTGRENIYLSGSILGMRKTEIDSNFDDIVKFAGTEKFLDTPVKHYSSGMQVRLGFAVAAHLKPDILIVDEVLAVGDAAFQKKSLGKMNDISKEGRAVLFVSHSMPTIENLCSRAIWIDKGRVVKDDQARSVISEYINTVNNDMDTRKIGEYQNLGHRRGTGEIQFTDFRLFKDNRVETREFTMGEDILAEVDFIVHKNVENAIFGFGLVDALSQVFITNWSGLRKPQDLKAGEHGTFSISIPGNPLRVRSYYFYLGVTGQGDMPYDIWDGVGTEFTVNYPVNTESFEFPVGRDVSLVSIPVKSEIKIEGRS